MICFDIETGPLPDEHLLAILPPFDAVAAVPEMGPFDPASVPTGNLKDPVKVMAKVNEARAKHDLLSARIPARREEAGRNYFTKFKEKAALSATTGVVKAIGWEEVDHDDLPRLCGVTGRDWIGEAAGCHFQEFQSESHLIKRFWDLWRDTPSRNFVGHNIHGFDLPFLVKRSWILGIDIPDGVQQSFGSRWSNQFVDTMQRWGCGQRELISLNDIARALGIHGKPDDCTGADFARMFDAGGEERETALKYLCGDLRMTKAVAEAMGIL